MDNNKIAEFISKQRVAFICSVDEEGFPNVKAMLKPRKMEGIHRFYFSTNTSSMRVKQYMPQIKKQSLFDYQEAAVFLMHL